MPSALRIAIRTDHLFVIVAHSMSSTRVVYRKYKNKRTNFDAAKFWAECVAKYPITLDPAKPHVMAIIKFSSGDNPLEDRTKRAVDETRIRLHDLDYPSSPLFLVRYVQSALDVFTAGAFASGLTPNKSLTKRPQCSSLSARIRRCDCVWGDGTWGRCTKPPTPLQ